MIIECPECGTKNQLFQSPQPDKKYRCGECGAVITFLQAIDASVGEDGIVEIIEANLNNRDIENIGEVGYVVLCRHCGQESPQGSRSCTHCGSMSLSTVIRPAKSTVPKIEPRTPDNTSGQGVSTLAEVPSEIKGWNWGAFLLNWIWAIGNGVWIGLLCLIPYVGIIFVFILGARGNEWAWQNKRWDSIEHFKRTQAKWSGWGFALLVIGLVVWLIVALVINAQ